MTGYAREAVSEKFQFFCRKVLAKQRLDQFSIGWPGLLKLLLALISDSHNETPRIFRAVQLCGGAIRKPV